VGLLKYRLFANELPDANLLKGNKLTRHIKRQGSSLTQIVKNLKIYDQWKSM